MYLVHIIFFGIFTLDIGFANDPGMMSFAKSKLHWFWYHRLFRVRFWNLNIILWVKHKKFRISFKINKSNTHISRLIILLLNYCTMFITHLITLLFTFQFDANTFIVCWTITVRQSTYTAFCKKNEAVMFLSQINYYSSRNPYNNTFGLFRTALCN